MLSLAVPSLKIINQYNEMVSDYIGLHNLLFFITGENRPLYTVNASWIFMVKLLSVLLSLSHIFCLLTDLYSLLLFLCFTQYGRKPSEWAPLVV